MIKLPKIVCGQCKKDFAPSRAWQKFCCNNHRDLWHQIRRARAMNLLNGPCAKQIVTATIITKSGEKFIGTNFCKTPQEICPRSSMPSGIGYELCKSVCNQPGHAEINALQAAGYKAKDAILYLDGHTYVCNLCMEACNKAGIAQIIIGEPFK